jgi:hypothetical protein
VLCAAVTTVSWLTLEPVSQDQRISLYLETLQCRACVHTWPVLHLLQCNHCGILSRKACTMYNVQCHCTVCTVYNDQFLDIHPQSTSRGRHQTVQETPGSKRCLLPLCQPTPVQANCTALHCTALRCTALHCSSQHQHCRAPDT